MEGLWHVLGQALLFATCLAGILSLVLGLPGTFLILGAALVYAWATGFHSVTWGTLGWLLALALLGEGIEFAAGMLGAARHRPSRKVALLVFAGGFAGGILGAPFLFGAGALPGALLGAFAGGVLGVLWEGGKPSEALATGWGALLGRLAGFVAKTAVAVAMTVLLAVAAL